jgi:glycosyltransferase involved in cell wall biosynthesis
MSDFANTQNDLPSLASFVKAGQFEVALEKVLSLRASSQDPLFLTEETAFIHLRLGQYAEAIEVYLKALDQNQLSIRASTYLAHALTLLNDSDAVPLLKAFLSASPDQPEFLKQVFDIAWLKQADETALQLKPFSSQRSSDFSMPGILFVSPCPVQEAGGGQNPVQLARALSGLGSDVLFLQNISPFLEEEPFTVWNDPFFTQPGPLSDYQWQAIQSRMAPWRERQQSLNSWCVLFYATPHSSSLARRLKAEGFKIAYYCLDDPSVFGEPLCIRRWEREIVAVSDKIMATSKILQNQLTDLYGRSVDYLPNGFNARVFQMEKDAPKPQKPDDLIRGDLGTVVYWGNLYGNWFDHQLVQDLAKLKPDWSFNLIGHFPEADQNPDAFQKKIVAENVHYLGEKQMEQLPAYGRFSDVALIPFFENEMTQTINPVKSYEYLACGLTVLSRPMPELEGFPGVQFIHTAEEASGALDAFLSKNILTLAKEKALMKTFIKEQTWQNRASKLLEIITVSDKKVSASPL